MNALSMDGAATVAFGPTKGEPRKIRPVLTFRQNQPALRWFGFPVQGLKPSFL